MTMHANASARAAAEGRTTTTTTTSVRAEVGVGTTLTLTPILMAGTMMNALTNDPTSANAVAVEEGTTQKGVSPRSRLRGTRPRCARLACGPSEAGRACACLASRPSAVPARTRPRPQPPTPTRTRYSPARQQATRAPLHPPAYLHLHLPHNHNHNHHNPSPRRPRTSQA